MLFIVDNGVYICVFLEPFQYIIIWQW